MVVSDYFFLEIFGHNQLKTRLVSFVLSSSVENTIFTDQAVCIIAIFFQSSAGVDGNFGWKMLLINPLMYYLQVRIFSLESSEVCVGVIWYEVTGRNTRMVFLILRLLVLSVVTNLLTAV